LCVNSLSCCAAAAAADDDDDDVMNDFDADDCDSWMLYTLS